MHTDLHFALGVTAALVLPGAPLADAAVAQARAGSPLKVGDVAPRFRLPTHNPAESGAAFVALADLVGAEATGDAKLVLLSFFATWCAPCKRELPLLAKLAGELGPKGLVVLAVAIDKDEAVFPEIRWLAKQSAVKFPVLRDRYDLLARQYLGDEAALPSVFLVRRDGTVAFVKQGYDKDASEFLRAEIDRALLAPL